MRRYLTTPEEVGQWFLRNKPLVNFYSALFGLGLVAGLSVSLNVFILLVLVFYVFLNRGVLEKMFRRPTEEAVAVLLGGLVTGLASYFFYLYLRGFGLLGLAVDFFVFLALSFIMRSMVLGWAAYREAAKRGLLPPTERQ